MAIWSGPTHSLPAEGQVALRLITGQRPEALDLLRHSCAHLMARAVMRLFDGVQLAFGPTVDNGFYYDFQMEHALSEEDFPEDRGRDGPDRQGGRAVRAGRDGPRRGRAASAATWARRSRSSTSKKAWPTRRACRSIARASSSISAAGRTCPAPAPIGAFKLLSVAGAYWKGDASRQQLQRLYGTAWFSKQDLEEHLQPSRRGQAPRSSRAGQATRTVPDRARRSARAWSSGCPRAP